MNLRDIHEIAGAAERTRMVVLGQAVQGTAELGAARADLTLELLEHRGFGTLALEVEASVASQWDRWICGESEEVDPWRLLHRQYAWPCWVTGNTEMVRFLSSLRELNSRRAPQQRVRIQGLDLYDWHGSIDALLTAVCKTSPALSHQLIRHFSRLEWVGYDPGALSGCFLPYPEGGAGELVEGLRERHQQRWGDSGEAPFFEALIHGDIEARGLWLEHLLRGLDRLHSESTVVAWLHDWSIQDLGPRLATRAALRVGFGAGSGTFVASRRWGAPYETLAIVPSFSGEVASSLEETLDCKRRGEICFRVARQAGFGREISLRGLGVVHDPGVTLRKGRGYRPVRLDALYDYYIYFRKVHPVTPLHVPFERAAFA